MDIRPIDPVVTNIEPTVHNDRDRRQKRQPGTKPSPGASPRPLPKEEGNPVYKPNGEVEEEPPPNIDVLV